MGSHAASASLAVISQRMKLELEAGPAVWWVKPLRFTWDSEAGTLEGPDAETVQRLARLCLRPTSRCSMCPHSRRRSTSHDGSHRTVTLTAPHVERISPLPICAEPSPSRHSPSARRRDTRRLPDSDCPLSPVHQTAMGERGFIAARLPNLTHLHQNP